MKASSKIDISVIIPAYNEAGNVRPLVREIMDILMPMKCPFEIIYVDDGSTDGTGKFAADLCREVPQLRLIRHKRNFGQSAAFMSGFENARGSVIITMDADLQNDPRDIPRMLEVLHKCDMVCGIREKREDDSIRRMSTKIANFVRDLFLNDGIVDAGCCMRVFRKKALVQVPEFKGMHRFLPAIVKFHGFQVRQMSVNHRPRYSGRSKYGIGNRLFVGIWDLIAMCWYRGRYFPPDRYEK